MDRFINIDNSLFVNNIGLLQSGAISTESQTNIDKMLSVSITNSRFISHHADIEMHQFEIVIFLIEYVFLLNLWSRCLCSLCLFYCLWCCGYCICTSTLHK